MITQISPSEKHTNESLNTLRYASKIKNCKNKIQNEIITNSNPLNLINNNSLNLLPDYENTPKINNDKPNNVNK
jgi:hypothetical protein